MPYIDPLMTLGSLIEEHPEYREVFLRHDFDTVRERGVLLFDACASRMIELEVVLDEMEQSLSEPHVATA